MSRNRHKDPPSVADLARAFTRAEYRGPAALAELRAKINAAAKRYHAGEPIEAAFFEILGDDPGGRLDS